MRRMSEIKTLPIGELSDEEICKAAMYRLNTRMCALVYVGDDHQVYFLYSCKDKIGTRYWSRIKTPLFKLWESVQSKMTIKLKKKQPDPIVKG